MTKLMIFRATARRAASKAAASPRRAPLVCAWTRDPASGKLICVWRRAGDSQAESDRSCLIPGSHLVQDLGRPPSVVRAAA